MNGFQAFSRRLAANSAAAAIRGAAILGATVALAGCADLHRAVTLPPVNPESPVAPTVAAAATRQYAVPRLTDVPPVPRNVPVAAEVKLDVVAMVRCRGGVERFAATHPALSSGTASFASDLLDVARVNPADVPSPDSAARSEAEAAQLRDYAAAPAALASGPPPTAADALPSAPSPPPGSQGARRGAPRPAPASQLGLAPVGTPDVPATATAASETPASPPFPAPLPDPMLARCS